jgi:hypothetical protein
MLRRYSSSVTAEDARMEGLCEFVQQRMHLDAETVEKNIRGGREEISIEKEVWSVDESTARALWITMVVTASKDGGRRAALTGMCALLSHTHAPFRMSSGH